MRLGSDLAATWCATFGGRPCTARTIRRWVEVGRLTNHGDRRRVIVDTDELVALLGCR